MKLNRKQWINRSPEDRRQKSVSWSGGERRMSGEKRSRWERVSTWSSLHKPVVPGELYDAHQLLP